MLALPVAEANATAIARSDATSLTGVVAKHQQQGLRSSGGDPGPDGCNYTSGKGCPCHHLNGGPCLFDVVADPSESHNLAKQPQHAGVVADMLARLAALSATHMPPAGLVGAALLADDKLQCRYVQDNSCFEPYGPFVPWLAANASSSSK